MNDRFPLIKLEGDHQTIGFNHGKILTERILQTIEFYKRIFKGDEKSIFKAAKYYKSKISEFNKAYCEEIEAIAEGAEVNRDTISEHCEYGINYWNRGNTVTETGKTVDKFNFGSTVLGIDYVGQSPGLGLNLKVSKKNDKNENQELLL